MPQSLKQFRLFELRPCTKHVTDRKIKRKTALVAVADRGSFTVKATVGLYEIWTHLFWTHGICSGKHQSNICWCPRRRSCTDVSRRHLCHVLCIRVPGCQGDCNAKFVQMVSYRIDSGPMKHVDFVKEYQPSGAIDTNGNLSLPKSYYKAIASRLLLGEHYLGTITLS